MRRQNAVRFQRKDGLMRIKVYKDDKLVKQGPMEIPPMREIGRLLGIFPDLLIDVTDIEAIELNITLKEKTLVEGG